MVGPDDLPPITLLDVDVRRRRRRVIHNFSVAFPSGVTALMGENGSGKSTLLKAMAGLLPHTGTVRFDTGATGSGGPGSAVTGPRVDRVVGFAPQSVRWPGRLTPRDVCRLAALLRRVPADLHDDAVDTALARAGAVDIAGTRCSALSGGQQRRVTLAQALVHDPPVLLLDEPTSELDPVFAEELAATIRDLAQSRTLVLSTHSIEDAARWDGGLVVLRRGGPPLTVSAAALGATYVDRVAAVRSALVLDPAR